MFLNLKDPYGFQDLDICKCIGFSSEASPMGMPMFAHPNQQGAPKS